MKSAMYKHVSTAILTKCLDICLNYSGSNIHQFKKLCKLQIIKLIYSNNISAKLEVLLRYFSIKLVSIVLNVSSLHFTRLNSGHGHVCDISLRPCFYKLFSSNIKLPSVNMLTLNGQFWFRYWYNSALVQFGVTLWWFAALVQLGLTVWWFTFSRWVSFINIIYIYYKRFVYSSRYGVYVEINTQYKRTFHQFYKNSKRV